MTRQAASRGRRATAVKHAIIDAYVVRALAARMAQGLPSTIEDHETLDRLAVLMRPREAA